MEFEIIEKGSTEEVSGNLDICIPNGCLIKIFAICPCVEGAYCEGYCSDYNCVCH